MNAKIFCRQGVRRIFPGHVEYAGTLMQVDGRGDYRRHSRRDLWKVAGTLENIARQIFVVRQFIQMGIHIGCVDLDTNTVCVIF